jgi:hypothetical protein
MTDLVAGSVLCVQICYIIGNVLDAQNPAHFSFRYKRVEYNKHADAQEKWV